MWCGQQGLARRTGENTGILGKGGVTVVVEVK
jgi:hypothetical protein